VARDEPDRALVELIIEGATNLAVAAAVLVWGALAVVPLVSLASGWAIVTGALILAAAHRLSRSMPRKTISKAPTTRPSSDARTPRTGSIAPGR
jgi:hypothetical protein